MNHQEALRKAIACLRLAKSSNEAEAALAAAKAQEIITRYNLDIADADFESNDRAKDAEPVVDFGEDAIDHANSYDWKWAYRLNHVLCEVNGCRSYIRRQLRGTKLCVVGRPSDVQTVRYMYNYLKSEVKRLMSANGAGHSVQWKVHYCIGCTDAIQVRLRAMKNETTAAVVKENQSNPHALMRVNTALEKQKTRDAAVERALNVVIYGTEDPKKKRTGRAVGYTQGYSDGRAAGRRDGASIRIGSAKAGLTSGQRQLN